MSKSKTTLLFSLCDINITQINTKYNINSEKTDLSNIDVEDNPNDTTKLSELNQAEKGIPTVISFLDESKRSHTCRISMIDFMSKTDINTLNYHCFWCRNTFKNKPLGCPLKYIPRQLTKKYYSYISKTLK